MKKTLKKDTTFTAKKGSWFMIGVCILVLAFLISDLVGIMAGSVKTIGGTALAYAVLLTLVVFFSCLMVYSVNMLKAKITIGPIKRKGVGTLFAATTSEATLSLKYHGRPSFSSNTFLDEEELIVLGLRQRTIIFTK